MVCLLLLSASVFHGYSVLTHEAIVDSVWDSSIKAKLLKRFPMATPDELEEAHAYTYGGCILQDMGYYPFSSKLFSDLTHYVRSGDFVVALIHESQDLNEYAFALGALAHYAADASGHSIATNLAVPLLYPELRAKYGRTVTYWDSPTPHLRTEFGFDVLQVAQGRYAGEQYHKFIGFKVARAVLERAFQDTYGMEMKDVFGSVDLALGSFRYGVSAVIPAMTKVAWQLKKESVIKETPGMTRKKFLYNISRAGYEKDYGKEYQKPGLRVRLLAWTLKVVPKVGPFKSLAFRAPTPEVEKLFMASFNATIDSYKALLAKSDNPSFALINENFDTGKPVEAGDYVGTDLTYDKLLAKLADHKFQGVSPDLRTHVLAYYEHRKPPVLPAKKKTLEEWEKVKAERGQLEQFQPQLAAN